MKKYLLVLLLLSISFTLFGCKPKKEDNDIPDINVLYTMDDFYNDLLMYEDKLDDILENAPVEVKTTTSPIATLSNEWDEYTTTITRDEINEARNNSSLDIVHESYYEQLTTTKMFVETIKGVIDGEEVELNQDYFPEDFNDTTFRFIKTDENYILIDALYGTHHHYLKLGLQDNLLDYQEFTYYFTIGEGSPRDEIGMNFSYFKFLENKEAVNINYSSTSSSLSCTNIEDDEEFTISTGLSIIEGPSYEEAGYVLNRYDRETNSRAYLQVVNNEIIGETYDIFDEHGSVFRYDDYDNQDGMIRLQVNFVTATGWDYVVASDGSNEEIDQLTGIFLENGTKIYDDWFNYTYTTNYGHLGLWIELENQSQLTDEVFSLNQYGMDLDHPYATVEHFNKINLDSFDDIKDSFQIEGLDFFSDNLHEELYNYVDEDIRNDVEGKTTTPIPPVETTGDVEEFEDAMSQYIANQDENRFYNIMGLTETNYIDENDQIVGSTRLNEYTNYDLDRLLYRYASLLTGMANDSYGYYVDGSTGKLIEFERENDSYVTYSVLDDQANEDNFNYHVNQFLNNNSVNFASSINQIDSHRFEIEINASYLQVDGIQLTVLYEQMGITGLGDQNIIILYEFEEDFTAYDTSYTIEGLTYSDGETNLSIEIISTASVSLEEFPVEVYAPLENPSYKFYLPRRAEDSIEIMSLGSQRVGLLQGDQYLAFTVEPGQYEVAVYGDYSYPEVTIYDSEMNQIPYDGTRFTASYDGLYYAKISSTSNQSADIYLRSNALPVFYHYTFSETGGTLIDEISLHGVAGSTITVPTATYDRFLVMDAEFIGEYEDDPMMDIRYYIEDLYLDNTCMLFDIGEMKETCYFYLPADYDIVMDVNGYYEGDFSIEYSYIDIPSGAFDNTHTWTDIYSPLELILTKDTFEARVDFTITESGSYILNTDYKDFDYSYQDAVLYSSDGTQLHYDWEYSMDLTPGDYYIIFMTDDPERTLLFIRTVIVKE